MSCENVGNKYKTYNCRKMLQMGSSKPWPDAMEVLTGQREMDASGLLDYFKPLSEWLEKENQKSGEYIGWEPTKKRKFLCNYRLLDFKPAIFCKFFFGCFR